jgi:glucosamine--fructose-6-phosphate aminotransferase (isomerizing)
MCGIIGYIGHQDTSPILIKGLRKLEYRGYDSAGIAVLSANQEIVRVRAIGKVDNLAEKVKAAQPAGHIGIAHTRWATHGGVTEENAHPHVAGDGKLVLVHNGIIENYRELKQDLVALGTVFTSETDTEVLAHLIALQYVGQERTANGLRNAVIRALAEVRGTYGIVVMHADFPDQLIAARMGSPLVIGIGEGEHYIASDPTPILSYTKDVVYLDDGEVAEITAEKLTTFNLKDQRVLKAVETIEWDEATAEKAGFPHFMLKEIHDQPTVIADAFRGRINITDGTSYLGGLNMTEAQMHSIERIVLIACGTASYAGMVGKYAFERLAGIPTEVDVASEFRYRDPIIDNKTLVFAISQSGETADTLAAVREAKRKGAYVRGIVNVVGSTIARETDGGTYIHAGPELAVASTKAYTNMATVLLLYAIQFGRLKRLNHATGVRLLNALQEIPEKMKLIFAQSDAIKKIANKYKDAHDMYFLGRGINYPVALEGSLKLKEISYIHAEGYPGGEMKHGPIALLSPEFPVFAIVTKNQLYEKMKSNVEEVKARGAKLILLATEGDEEIKQLADDVIYVPETMELLEPLLNTVATQLFAYHTATLLGRDVDRPRNLAKSVTVE